MALKLRQGQIWNLGDQFVRIVHLERLEVQYKTFKILSNPKGEHHHTSKKEFCKLLKNAILMPETTATAATKSEPPVIDTDPPAQTS
jgi:hypothetical protein